MRGRKAGTYFSRMTKVLAVISLVDLAFFVVYSFQTGWLGAGPPLPVSRRTVGAGVRKRGRNDVVMGDEGVGTMRYLARVKERCEKAGEGYIGDKPLCPCLPQSTGECSKIVYKPLFGLF